MNAARCSVCGSRLAPSVAVSTSKPISGPRVPAVTLSLPVIFGLALLLLVAGAAVVYGVMSSMNDSPEGVVAAAPTDPNTTATLTATITTMPTETGTPTPEPTWTAEPPIEYRVAQGDTCLGIALNFGVSVSSIAILNQLSADCSPLSVGQVLLIPRPTATPSPMPSATLNPTELVQSECETVDYIVKDNDTLGGIAANYAVSAASVRAYNNMASDVVYVGQKLIIPLCEQSVETATPTPIPPYRAPNLLLPADGAAFVNPGEIITLQWDAVGDLRQNEMYAVTLEDVTENNARKWVNYVADQKFTVPAEYRPTSETPHVYRWSVLTVRQTGTDSETEQPIYEPAGDVSAQRVFTWMGGGGGAPAPTQAPQPTETAQP